jgi:hypothetical protein
MSSIAIVALGVASEDDLRGIIELARAMIHRGGSPTVTPSVITHAQYEHALVESGVNFVDAGPCPFAARHDTKEGKALSGGGSGGGGSGGGGGEGLSSDHLVTTFMNMLTEQWFEVGKRALRRAPPYDLVILATKTAFFVYSSLCELESLNYAILDNSPLTKTAEFGPPRGFGASQSGFRWVNQARWDVHAKSMWSCLYRDGVNGCRRAHGLPPFTSEIGPWQQVEELSSADAADASAGAGSGRRKRRSVPIFLAFSALLLPRPSEWSLGQVHILGPLLPSRRLLESDQGRGSRSDDASVAQFLAVRPDLPLVYCCLGERFASWGRGRGSGGSSGRGDDDGAVARQALMSTCVRAIHGAGARAVVVCLPKSVPHVDRLRLLSKDDGRLLVLGRRPTTEAELRLLSNKNNGGATPEPAGAAGATRNAMLQNHRVPISGSSPSSTSPPPSSSWSSSTVLCSGDPWTVHMALASGSPVVCVDFARDDTSESFWAARAAAVGAAAPPLAAEGMEAPALEETLRGVIFLQGAEGGADSDSDNSSTYRSAAAELARAMRERASGAANDGSGGKDDRGDDDEGDESIDGACRKILRTATALQESRDASFASSPPPPPPLQGTSSSSPAAVMDQHAAAKAESGAANGGADDGEGEAEDGSGRRLAGFSFSHREAAVGPMFDGATNVWRKGDEAAFRVRTGPNYKK